MKTALVIGGNGFIGYNLTKRLKEEGWHVTILDQKLAEFGASYADMNIIEDASTWKLDKKYDRIYQLAADMGGAGFIFSGNNDADVMTNSASINLNILKQVKDVGVGQIFYSSSACVYSAETAAKRASEADAYPANPDSDYGWEKLFSERLYQAYARNYGINIRIARFNNTYGEFSTYEGGREKSPAAICRKVLEYQIEGKPIEIWGDGQQVREFVYIDDLLNGIEAIMQAPFDGPTNIGPETNITIDGMVRLLTDAPIEHVDGPIGLNVRLTTYDKIEALGWTAKVPLTQGLVTLMLWIKDQKYP